MASEDAIIGRLRSATEADVEAVLALPTVTGDIEFASSAVLLEFFDRMLDLLLVREGSEVASARK
jgi:hypothetical protein